MGKEPHKAFLFVDDMVMYIRNPKESTKNISAHNCTQMGGRKIN